MITYQAWQPIVNDSKRIGEMLTRLLPVRAGLGSYFRQSAIIILSLLAAKILGVFAQARAALYLGPENYGISGIFIGLVPFVILLSNLRTDVILVREYPDREAKGSLQKLIAHVFSFRGGILIIVTLLVAALLYNYPSYLLCWLLAVPFYASQALRPYWLVQAQRKLHIHYSGMLVQTVCTAACVFAFFRPSQFLGADLLAYSVGGLVALVITWRWVNGGFPKFAYSLDMFHDARELVQAARWILITACFSLIYTSFEMPLIVLLKSESDAGTYRTAVSLSQNLYTFLTFLNALLYPHLVQWHRNGACFLWRKQLRILALFSALGVLVFVVFSAGAPLIYDILYRGSYLDAIPSFRLLVAAKVFMLLAGIFSWGLMAMKRDKVLLLILVPLSSAALAAAWLTIPKFGIVASAFVACAFSFLFFGLTLAASWHAVSESRGTRK